MPGECGFCSGRPRGLKCAYAWGEQGHTMRVFVRLMTLSERLSRKPLFVEDQICILSTITEVEWSGENRLVEGLI